jgi:hypothetical protein
MLEAENKQPTRERLRQWPIDASVIINEIKKLIDQGIITGEFLAKYEVAEGFDSANGKFPNNLGNVALADCRSLGPKMADNFYGLAEELNKTQYFYLTPFIEAIGD